MWPLLLSVLAGQFYVALYVIFVIISPWRPVLCRAICDLYYYQSLKASFMSFCVWSLLLSVLEGQFYVVLYVIFVIISPWRPVLCHSVCDLCYYQSLKASFMSLCRCSLLLSVLEGQLYVTLYVIFVLSVREGQFYATLYMILVIISPWRPFLCHSVCNLCYYQFVKASFMSLCIWS